MLRELIIQARKDTGILLIKADQEGAVMPDPPFAVYKLTSPYIKGRGYGAITYSGDEGSAQEILTEQPIMTVSLTAYGKSEDEAGQIAMYLHDWFRFYGSDYLLEKEIAVHDLGNIENRTTHLIDHYEYKHGFDVQLRTERTLIREIDFIEKV